jgi:hypothetical protein
LGEIDRTTSLFHAVLLWVRLLRSGSYRWDAGADRPYWASDYDSIPLFARLTGLARGCGQPTSAEG